MRFLIVLLLIAAAWGGYRHFYAPQPAAMTPIAATATPRAASTPVLPKPGQSFSCDGRTHCTHMRSCEEATFFIRNCPGTKMDGDHDGVPCEAQWCG